MEVVKRNGSVATFDRSKITNAVRKAFIATKEIDNDLIQEMSDEVTDMVIESLKGSSVTVEQIQDIVEKTLMQLGFFDTSKSYILYRAEHARIRVKKSDPSLTELCRQSSAYFDGDTMREFVYFRTYSKWLDDKGRREVWIETVQRYMDFMYRQLGDKLTGDEYAEIREAILKQEVMPSMRLLQFAGPAAEKENFCCYNCAYTAPKCPRDLAEIMYISMTGVGVGYSVEARNVECFPAIARQKDPPMIHNHIVGDSREGWCNAFLFCLEKWYIGEDVKLDYSQVRPNGARLKTIGGRASGPQPLRELIEFTREIFMKRAGRKLTTLDMYDIICMIGRIVVVGGVRRTAMISLSDLCDNDIRDAKKGSFWQTSPQRSMANNSAVYTSKPDMLVFMEEWLALAKSGTGERGIFNRDAIDTIIPLRRQERHLNHQVEWGCNPCSEVLLQPKQLCNLTEVVCRPNDDIEILLRKCRIATILGTYQATLTKYGYVSSDWRQHQEDERLLGVSLTGQFDCPVVRDSEALNKLREHAIQVNQEYAKRFGINEATAITTVKPSGTVSQMVNSSSGVHTRFAPYYIRRIRIGATDPLLKLMVDQGYPCYPEVGQTADNATTFVLEFPVKAPDDCITADKTTAIEQLEYWKLVKVNYAEHSVSQTIYVKNNEWMDVGVWVYKNWDIISGLSFLPYSDHVYQLAPYEAITKEKYEELAAKVPKVDFSKLIYYEKEDRTELKREVACTGDKCEL